jgi:hypothetical protein
MLDVKRRHVRRTASMAAADHALPVSAVSWYRTSAACPIRGRGYACNPRNLLLFSLLAATRCYLQAHLQPPAFPACQAADMADPRWLPWRAVAAGASSPLPALFLCPGPPYFLLAESQAKAPASAAAFRKSSRRCSRPASAAFMRLASAKTC